MKSTRMFRVVTLVMTVALLLTCISGCGSKTEPVTAILRRVPHAASTDPASVGTLGGWKPLRREY
jgi:hypothetical protein